MAKHPDVGDEAPDFELEGTHGTFKLSDHRGERVLLLFYPGDETTVCTKQFCSYRDNSEAFGALGVTAVGISGEERELQEAVRGQERAHRAAAGGPRPARSPRPTTPTPAMLKATKRAVIVVGEDGKVLHRHDHALGLDFQTVADLQKTLDSLPATA